MARLHAQPDTPSQPRFDVSLVDWYSDDEEETGPWCVDYGDRIEVLRTRDIQRLLQGGALDPDVKVWRDGRACWLPIAECYELTVTPPPVVMASDEARPDPRRADGMPSRRPTRIGGVGVQRLGAVVMAAFVVGIGLGALVVLPEAAAAGHGRRQISVERAFDALEQVSFRADDRGARRLVAR